MIPKDWNWLGMFYYVVNLIADFFIPQKDFLLLKFFLKVSMQLSLKNYHGQKYML